MMRAIKIYLMYLVLTSYKLLASNLTRNTLADQIAVDDVAFMRLGTYRGFTDDGIEYKKSFFVQRYSIAPWAESKAICRAFNLESVSFETLTESREFLTMIENFPGFKSLNTVWMWLDGIALIGKSKTDWYWSKSGRNVAFPMDWYINSPGSIDQFCMCIGRQTLTTTSGFNDCYCNESYMITCQRTEFLLTPKFN